MKTITYKFSYPDVVWSIIDNKAIQCQIHSSEIKVDEGGIQIKHYIKFGSGNDYTFKVVFDENCYSTKEELIASL